jgi:hypothetical protein
MDNWDNTIRERLKYDPDTGDLIQRKRCPEKCGHKWAKWWNETHAGSKLGKRDKDGYIQVDLQVGGRRKGFRAHRIAWFLFYGQWPIKYLDHINGQRDDNRIDNLREITHEENRKGSLKRTVTDQDGVFLNDKSGKWIPYVYVVYGGNGRKRHLGAFDTEKDAWDHLTSYKESTKC